MRSKSLSLINKLDDERRQLRLEEGKKYAEQKRRYLLKQENDRKLKTIQQKEEIKDKLLSLKETTRKLASVPLPETPLKKLIEIRNSLSQDIDRIIEADKIDNEALRYAIIGDEVTTAADKGIIDLSESLDFKSLSIQENISAGLPPMNVPLNKHTTTKSIQEKNKVTNTKTINSKAPINKPSNKVVENKKQPVTVKTSLTRRVNDPGRLQRNTTYVTKPNPSNASKSNKKIPKYDNDSSLLDMLETQEHNSFVHVSNLRDTEKTQQVKYYYNTYNDTGNIDPMRMSTTIHQNMQSVVSEVSRLSLMLDDLNKEIELKVSSGGVALDVPKTSNFDQLDRVEATTYDSLQFEKRQDTAVIGYPVETFDDTVNYCDDDDDEVQRRSFESEEDDNEKIIGTSLRVPETIVPSKDEIMKNIVDKLHRNIRLSAAKAAIEDKDDGERIISTDRRTTPTAIRAAVQHVEDDDGNKIRPYPFQSTKAEVNNEEIFTEDLNLFPFPLYNDKRNDDDNAQYQRLETLQDPQTRAELGYLQDRKLIMHQYGNDFVVENILDTAAFDSVPTNSSYDQFSKNYIKSTLDSIDTVGKREVEKIRESDGDVKITSHILPSGMKPTVTWSSNYGLLPSLRNIGELAGMISSDYDTKLYANNDYVVTDDEQSISDDEEHCIVNIAANELAKKGAEEKVEVRVASEKSKHHQTFIEEVDIKNESIAETSVDSEEEINSPTSKINLSDVFTTALKATIPEIVVDDSNDVINASINSDGDPEFDPVPSFNATSTDSSSRPRVNRLSPAELRQVMLNELRKQDEILNYELELSEIEQAHTIQSASNIVERFISSKELETIESKRQQELFLQQQAYEMSLTTALLNAQMNMHSESVARNEIIADLQSQMREQELNQDYANLISCTSQMVELFQQPPVAQSETTAQELQREFRKPTKDTDFVAGATEKVNIAYRQPAPASPIRTSQQNISMSSSIIDEVPDIRFTPIKKFSNRDNVFSPASDYYSDEFEEIEEDEISEDIIDTARGYTSPRESKSLIRPEVSRKSDTPKIVGSPAATKNDSTYSSKFETIEFSKTFKEFEAEINNRKKVQEKKLMLQSQLLKSKRDKHLNRIQQMKQNAEGNQSSIYDLINEEKQVKEKYLEHSIVLEREKWSINATYYRDLRKLRQMQLDYEFCGGTIDFDGNRDLVDVSLSSRRSSSSSKPLYNNDQDIDEEIEEIEDDFNTGPKRTDVSMEHVSMVSSKLSLSPKSIKHSIDDVYDEEFEEYRDRDVTIRSVESRKAPNSYSPAKKSYSPASKKGAVIEYQPNENYSKEIESIEETIAEHQNRIKIIKQNIVGIESDDKHLDMLLKKKAEKERLAAEEARLFKSLNDKLNQISTSKETATKSLEENTRLAANISKWVHSIREPFVKTIEILQEEDSLDDSSWCSDIEEVQISKLPMRLDTYIEKRVKHQFSALKIQTAVRGWLVRKKIHVATEVFSGDLGLYKMRGNLVKEHAAAVAVEDMALEDSFTSENESANFEGQFHIEQKQLQKQMEKVEEMSNILSKKAKLDIQINEAQIKHTELSKLSEPALEVVSNSDKTPSLKVEIHEISNAEKQLATSPVKVQPSLVKAQPSPHKLDELSIDEERQASPEKSPIKSPEKSPIKSPEKSSVTSPEKSPIKSPEKSPVKATEASIDEEQLTSSSIESPMTSPAKSPMKAISFSQEADEDLSIEEQTSPVNSPEKLRKTAVENENLSSDDANSPVKSLSGPGEDMNIAVFNADSDVPIDSSIEDVEYKPNDDVLEASEIIEDDFEIEEEEDLANDVQDREYSDNEEIEEDVINDLSSPGKAVILDDSDNLEFDDYSDDPSQESRLEDNSVKNIDSKSKSLSSLSDMPPLLSKKITPQSDDTDFDELYDFDDDMNSSDMTKREDIAQSKQDIIDVPVVVDWIENIDSFFSQILEEVDMLTMLANLDNPEFNEKFIPVQLFNTIHRNFQHDYNMVDHCRAVFDRVNDLLTELHQLRHGSSAATSDSYSRVLIAKSMVLNGKNVRNYIKDKLENDQKRVNGIMPDVKVNLDMIETSIQTNLTKAADELTDIIMARMLSDISQQLIKLN